jgi:hypothetical protein
MQEIAKDNEQTQLKTHRKTGNTLTAQWQIV